jgi:uncharacterized protein YjbI with pentapeptide repeats
MNQLFQIASSVSTPLAIAGFLAAVVFLIFRQILAKDIFPKLTAALGSTLIRAIIDRLFYLTLAALILGFIGFLAKPILEKFNFEPTTAERIGTYATSLLSTSADARIIAVTQIGKVESASKDEAEDLLMILANHIARIGVLRSNSNMPDLRREMATTFHAMGRVLKMADDHGYEIIRPDFNHLNAAGLDLSSIYLAGTRFTDSNFSQTIFDGATLKKIRLVGIKATGMTARAADLSDSLIQQSCLEEGSFADGKFTNAIFRSSDLNNANLSKAVLISVSLENTRLLLANLKDAQVADADLSGALEFSPNQAREVKFNAMTRFPPSAAKKSFLTVCRK